MKTVIQKIWLSMIATLAIGVTPVFAAPPAPLVPLTQEGDRDPVMRTVLSQGTFSGNNVAPTAAAATYTVGTGEFGETIVEISGDGATVTLPDIQQALARLLPDTPLLTLEDAANKVWLARANILIGRSVTLQLNAATVQWLKLRSGEVDITTTRVSGDANYNYSHFAWLRTLNGTILIDGVRVTSWDVARNDYDTNVADGRSYVLAKGDARLDIANADLSYLGSADGESYGVSWRDTNSDQQPDVLRTRVTGDVIHSTFSYNYYGIYTYQASNMVFRGNRFHHNLGYGFDPHDFTHHVLVENNQAFENGNHGFIISRGCNNFVFRGNLSYNNHYRLGEADRRAHGFMIDPGSPNSQYPQVASFDNLFENNQAYGNEGYGMRVLGSNTNIIQNNTFRDNLQGITIEQGSTGNTLKNNTVSDNTVYGVFLFGGANSNTIVGNTVTGNRRHGIYLTSGVSRTSVMRNVVSGNYGQGIRANGADTTTNTWQENQVFDNRDGGIVITSAANTGIPAPKLVREGTVISGSAAPGAVIELFSDNGGQGRFFETRVTAGADGSFRVERNWQGANVNATATDSNGNSSAFTLNRGTLLPAVYLPLTQR